MNYYIYKMNFISAVHFGVSSLEDSRTRFYADTLFSALCIEAKNQKEGMLDVFVEDVKAGNLLISDALPFIGDIYYLPKPAIRIEHGMEEGNSVRKKAFKKLEYLPTEKLETYLNGKYDPIQEVDQMCALGKHDMRVLASIAYEAGETVPYRMDTFRFGEDCGLYILIGYREKKSLKMIEELLRALSYSGIGGKRSSGFGRFQMEKKDLPEKLWDRLALKEHGVYMTLSAALPGKKELEEAVKDASYSLVKRSGFVYSDSYADTFMRKKDLYMMKAGACFTNRFNGDIYDVSINGKHPVYRYAKPLFMEVGRV